MANVRVKIESSSIPSTVTAALWDTTIIHEREREQVFYRLKMSQLKFIKADYSLIFAVDDCEEITVTVEQECTESWVERFVGVFTKYDCEIDEDRCIISVTPKPTDEYKCLLDAYDTDEEIYNASSTIIVRAFHGTYESGAGCSQCCTPTYNPTPCDQFNLSDDYCVESNSTSTPTTGFCAGQFLTTTCWHRVVGVGTPTTPPPYGTGWTHLSGNNWWRCPSFSEISIGVLNYGRLFNSVLTYLVSTTGCGLTVRSHFFGINATHAAAPSNAAYTFAVDRLQHMTVHQKSDVKRPDASNPAFSWVWIMKLKDLLDDLRTMFNVYWIIDGTSLIIEHISYFEAVAGLDLSGIRNQRKYKQGDDGAPAREAFQWSDNVQYGTAYEGWPITYGCGEGVRENKVKLFTTQVSVVKASENAEDISDRNFVLVSNQVVYGVYAAYLDDPLGWVKLHDKLHRHNRYFAEGSMNNAASTFLSSRKTRKLEQFTTALCCTDTFNPSNYITTSLGAGEVEKATINLHREKLELTLKI